MSSRIDPTLLGAYVDGELTVEEIGRVEALLAQSPGDRQAAETLRAMNLRLASAFEAPLRAPLGPALRAVLADGARPRRVLNWWPATGMALAASIALATGLFMGAHRAASPNLAPAGTSAFAASSPLHALLEAGPDGGGTDLDGGAATLVATFLDGQGRPCREVELSEGDATSLTQAIACRGAEGWVIEVAVTRPAAPSAERAGYVPASGVGDEVIDAALDALQAGPVLGPAEVEDLIDAHWSPR